MLSCSSGHRLPGNPYRFLQCWVSVRGASVRRAPFRGVYLQPFLGSSQLRHVTTCVCKKYNPPDKRTLESISLNDTTSVGKEQLLLLFCRAEDLEQGHMFVHRLRHVCYYVEWFKFMALTLHPGMRCARHDIRPKRSTHVLACAAPGITPDLHICSAAYPNGCARRAMTRYIVAATSSNHLPYKR